ncbi:MAG: pseudouridine synthase [Bacteroidota bacterium]
MDQQHHRYFMINKPYKMVSQFVSNQKEWLLGDLEFRFPEGTHAVGRLDKTSEGLLLLTTNKSVTKLLFESDIPHKRTYLIQVEKLVTHESLEQLRNGVSIGLKDGGSFITSPCNVKIVTRPAALPVSMHEFGSHLAQTWLELSLTEGKFHQVRKMVAAVGHHCKRLIRLGIEDIWLQDLDIGHVKELEETAFFQQLKIDNWRENYYPRMEYMD